jgi:peptidyl-prolyl cis-trans isomerase D
MLNQFRAIAGNFAAKLLLAFLVLTFAVWGIGDMVRHPAASRTVATIGRSPIYIETYQAAVRRETESLRQSLGDKYTPEIVKSLHPEIRALQTLIRQSLLKQEAESLGIIPSDADVVRRIRSNPSFQESGKFNKERLEAALRNNRMSEKNYVDLLRQDMASGLIMDAFTVSLPVSDSAVKTWHDAEEESRNAALYVLDEAQAGALPSPKPGELEDYFAKHIGEFATPESRMVSYAVVKPEDARDKVTVSEEALLAAYKDRLDEFKRPERRDVDQLLFASEDDANKAAAALQSGKSFDSIANSTAIVNKGSVSLGKVEHDHMLDVAANDVFSLQKDGVTKPIQSAFGWHIFRVKSIEPPSTAPLSDVRALLEKDVKQQTQENAETTYLNKLEDTLAGGATLQEAAKEFSLKLQTVGPILRTGGAKLPELDRFLDTAFAATEKTESPLTASKGGVYYVLRVDSVTPERNRSLEEVRSAVTAAWQKEARAKRLANMADDIGKSFGEKKSREATIAKYHLSPAFTGPLKRSSDKAGNIALPSGLAAELFKHAEGEGTSVYPLASGGYIVAVAGERIPAGPMDPGAAAGIRASLSRSMIEEASEDYLRYLERKFPIDVNEKLLQALSQSED